MNKSDFAIFVKKRRKELGMTQDELASKLHVSRNVISKWENGERYPDLEMSQQLINILAVSADEMYEQSSINDNKHSHVVKNVLIGVLSVLLIAGLIIVPITINRKPKSVEQPTEENPVADTVKYDQYFGGIGMLQEYSATIVNDNYIYTTDEKGQYVRLCGNNESNHGTVCSAYVQNKAISFLHNNKRIIIEENEPDMSSGIYTAEINGSNRKMVGVIDGYLGDNAIIINDKMYLIGRCGNYQDGVAVTKSYGVFAIDLKNFETKKIAGYPCNYEMFNAKFFVDRDRLYFAYTKNTTILDAETQEYEQNIYEIKNDELILQNIIPDAVIDYAGVIDGRIYYTYCSDSQNVYYWEDGKINTFMPIAKQSEVKIVGDNIIVISLNSLADDRYEEVISRYNKAGTLINSKTMLNGALHIYGTFGNMVCFGLSNVFQSSPGAIYLQNIDSFINPDFDKTQQLVMKSVDDAENPTKSDELIDGDWEYFYHEWDNTVSVRRYLGNDEVVELPTELGGYKVLSYDKMVFQYRGEYCESIIKMIVPEGLNDFTAAGCINLKEIVLPEGLEYITDEAFFNCYSLEKIVIPSSVKIISQGAFSGCKNLKEIVFPDGLTEIYNGAFHGCSSLENLILPSNLQLIDYHAFDGCTALKSIRFPNSISCIREAAFENCDNLTDVYFGNQPFWSRGCKEIFEGCNNLTIHCEPGSFAEKYAHNRNINCITDYSSASDYMETYFSDDGMWEYAIMDDKTYIIGYFGDEENVVITDEILGDAIGIKYCTFAGHELMRNITIPESVTEIDKYVFTGCYGLTFHCKAGSYAEKYAEENGWYYENE